MDEREREGRERDRSIYRVHEWTVEGLARSHRWSHLMEFAKKKSPIGYAVSIHLIISFNNILAVRSFVYSLWKKGRSR